MYCKVFVLLILLLPACAFAGPFNSDDGVGSGAYMKLQYNRDFQSSVDRISSAMKEYPNAYSAEPSATSDSPTAARGEVKSYDTKYKPSYLSGSAAIGYSFGSFKVELEGLHSRLNVDGRNYSVANLAKWLSMSQNHNNASIKEKSLQFHNDGFTNWAGMLNLYLDDLSLKKMIVMPYIGGGVGVTKTSFLGSDHYNIAYQAKVGVSHALNSYVKLFAGYRYFALLDGEFHNIKPTNAGTHLFNSSSPSLYRDAGSIPDKVSVRNKFAIHGFELGVIINFYADSY